MSDRKYILAMLCDRVAPRPRRELSASVTAPVFYERFAKIQWRLPKVAPYTTLRLAPLGIDEGDCWLEGTTQTFRIGSPAEAEL